MATGPTRNDLVPGSRRASPGRREARLAELVAELAPCDTDAALEAVRARPDLDDPLELVARAMTGVRHRALEPQDRLRVAGFLRAGTARLPRRTPSGATLAPPPDRAEHRLVHHGSLRRWERTGVAEAADPHPDLGIDPDDAVIDLRDRTARFRRPGPS